MSGLALLALLRRCWPLLAGAALLLALWWWHGGQVRAVEQRGQAAGRAAVQAQWDAETQALRAAADQANRDNTRQKDQDHARVTTAQSLRAVATARDSADLRRLGAERDGLRRDLASALGALRRCDLPAPAAAAAAQRAAALDDVLADMERAGADMARAAAGHAADSLMYQQAWPRPATADAQDP